MTNRKPFLFRERLGSFRYAFAGIGYLLRYQHNFRIHLVAVVLVTLAGIFLKVSVLDWALLVIAMSLVLISEILNSSIEHLANVVSPAKNESIRKAKDTGAAAVLVASLAALVIGILVFLPGILDVIRRT